MECYLAENRKVAYSAEFRNFYTGSPQIQFLFIYFFGLEIL